MSAVTAIALSGLNAATTSLGTSGHNLANLATPGFKRQVATTQTAPDGGGVTTQIDTAAAPGNDTATDLVGLLAAKNAFMANLTVFRTADEMAGTLLKTQA